MTNPIAEIARLSPAARLLLQAEGGENRRIVEYVRAAPEAIRPVISRAAATVLAERIGGDSELWEGYLNVTPATDAPRPPRRDNSVNPDYLTDLETFQIRVKQLAASRHLNNEGVSRLLTEHGAPIPGSVLRVARSLSHLTQVQRTKRAVLAADRLTRLLAVAEELIEEDRQIALLRPFVNRALQIGTLVVVSDLARRAGVSPEITEAALRRDTRLRPLDEGRFTLA